MTRAELTEKLLDIKREKGWSWNQICSEIGGMSPVLVTGALLGQMKLTKPQGGQGRRIVRLEQKRTSAA
jgi:cyanate lyase